MLRITVTFISLILTFLINFQCSLMILLAPLKNYKHKHLICKLRFLSCKEFRTGILSLFQILLLILSKAMGLQNSGRNSARIILESVMKKLQESLTTGLFTKMPFPICMNLLIKMATIFIGLMYRIIFHHSIRSNMIRNSLIIGITTEPSLMDKQKVHINNNIKHTGFILCTIILNQTKNHIMDGMIFGTREERTSLSFIRATIKKVIHQCGLTWLKIFQLEKEKVIIRTYKLCIGVITTINYLKTMSLTTRRDKMTTGII